jgi:tetratricopeptide (TPR) repeat protein
MELRRIFVVTVFLAAAGLSQVGCQNSVLAAPRDSQEFTDSGGGQHHDASHYTKAIGQRPDDALAFVNLGKEKYRNGLFQAAVDDFTKAIEINPNYARAYESRAWAYYALKDYESAWSDVNSCRQLGGKPDSKLVDNLTKADSHSSESD